jgi:acetylglutamate kinase
MSHEAESARSEVLLDALPFIQEFRGQIFVIKYGGSAMEDEHLVERTLKDIVFMQAVGIRPVIVHGGGKAITNRMREAGLRAQFVDGLRVTDAASMAIVEHTLHEVVNPMIASTIERFGGKSIGISGRKVIRARKVYAARSRRKGDTVDLGLVGEVSGITLGPIHDAIEREMIPVVSPIGVDDSGTALNINADVAAGAVAGELKATKLIFISDVLGIMRDPSEPDSLIPSVNRELIAKLIKDEIIEGGMIPKVDSAVAALEHGVAKAHLIDGRLAHSLLREIFTNSGIGTEIVA